MYYSEEMSWAAAATFAVANMDGLIKKVSLSGAVYSCTKEQTEMK